MTADLPRRGDLPTHLLGWSGASSLQGIGCRIVSLRSGFLPFLVGNGRDEGPGRITEGLLWNSFLLSEHKGGLCFPPPQILECGVGEKNYAAAAEIQKSRSAQ